MNQASLQNQITDLKGQFKDKREKDKMRDNQKGIVVITAIITVVIVDIVMRKDRRRIKKMIESLIGEVDKTMMSLVAKDIGMILKGIVMRLKATTPTMMIDNAQKEETIEVMIKRVEDMEMMITRGTHHHLIIENDIPIETITSNLLNLTTLIFKLSFYTSITITHQNSDFTFLG